MAERPYHPILHRATLIGLIGLCHVLMASPRAARSAVSEAGPQVVSQPGDLVVAEGKTAVFVAGIQSPSRPTVVWYRIASPADVVITSMDPNVTTSLLGPNRSGTYTATLSVKDVTLAVAGLYYCRANNGSGTAVDSAPARLAVKGLVAWWSLDQSDLLGGLLWDRAGGHHARPVGRPEFVTGADGRRTAALAPSTAEGWGTIDEFDLAGGAGELSLSLWTRQEDKTDRQDLESGDPNGPSQIIASRLKPDGLWHHLCMAYDGTSARITVDAVPTDQIQLPLPSAAAALLGVGLNAGGRSLLECGLDDVRIYSQALTISKAAALYEDMVAGQEVVDEGAKGVHDPTIIRQADTYYLFCTGRGIPIRRSRDLIHWELIGRVFPTLPQWVIQRIPGVGSLWAPDVTYRNGRYWVYYAASTLGSSTSCIGMVSSPTLDPCDPGYGWSDGGLVISTDSSSNYNAIDPDVVQDEQGQWWLVFGSFWTGIKLTHLDPNTGKPDTQPLALYSIASRPSTAIEGAFVLHRNGYYYLFVSFDQCCLGVNSTYNIRVGRATDIAGPYVDKDGVAMKSGGGTLVLEGGQRWKGPGHNSVLADNGQDYLVYHAYDAQEGGQSALRIKPLYWSADLWPEVGRLITLP
jgi:arabinan endo-1,5-alpha-L-arabinosidase